MKETQSISNSNQIKKLGEVCTYSKGKKPAILKETKTKECSIPYINIKAFEKGIISEYTNGEKCNICEDDDLLMVWDGARCGLIGKAKKGGSRLNFDEDFKGKYSQRIFVSLYQFKVLDIKHKTKRCWNTTYRTNITLEF